MRKLTRTCLCGVEISDWRACPIRGCNAEAVWCQECGGDEKASRIMRQHIYARHTDTVVSKKALIAFRSKLLMRHYRDLPDGLDIGHMLGYVFMHNPEFIGTPTTLRGEILPDIEITQMFRWVLVEKGSNWEGYYALRADESGGLTPIIPVELKI
jgi:hypothetical protein